MARVGVVLLNLGGPAELADVEAYLFSLFQDPYILEFPRWLAWLRRPLARRISRKRAPETQENYRKIGGGSPIHRNTEAQRAALQAELTRRGHDAAVVVAMRAWKPRADVAATALAATGIERGVALPLYPQFARATTLSAFEDFEESWAKTKRQVPWMRVRSYPDQAGYIGAVAADMKAMLETIPAARHPTTALFFSAHGLPVKSASHPQETYPAEVERTVKAALAAVGWHGRWHLGYQSRVGRVKWLEPYPEEILERMAAEGTTDAVVYPVAFVSDHSETLFELDLLYGDMARKKGIAWHRVAALNDRPAFIAALADLVEDALSGPGT